MANRLPLSEEYQETIVRNNRSTQAQSYGTVTGISGTPIANTATAIQQQIHILETQLQQIDDRFVQTGSSNDSPNYEGPVRDDRAGDDRFDDGPIRDGEVTFEAESGSVFASARPFTFKANLLNAVNCIYKIQVYDDDLNTYVDFTNKLRQPVSLGSDSIVMIDPSQILSDAVMTTVRITGGGATRLKHNLRKFKIISTPEMISNSGLLVHNEDESQWASTFDNFVIDAAPQHKQVALLKENLYLTRYFISDSSPQHFRFLTNRPHKIHRCEPRPYSSNMLEGFNDYISFMCPQDQGLIANARITVQDDSGSQTAHTYEISGTQNEYGAYSLGIGIRQLKDYLGSSTWSTITNSYTERVIRIEYWLVNFNGAQVTNTMTTEVSNKNCCIENTDSVELMWKNRWGGNDTFMLKGAVTVEERHEHELFQRAQGFRRQITEDGTHPIHFDPYNYQNTFHQGSTNVAKIGVKATKRLKVVSQFMNRETINWVAEIATAPRVWIRESYDDVKDDMQSVNSLNGLDLLQQVYINTTDVTLKDKKTGLGQVEYELTFANPITTQRL
ncbi:MAG: hypothetical protein Unbinned2716contig1000_15 [Prokaryotic dsDNA virus sp.]|nr:MAG: hypothetical protein Unbinned2716contig1000_15 [Prokaryotic dsDNA virus sp.]|tara:strand:+ start:22450 stop:24126 length:1677 start_codon:yes stop_codon:yes gene_type:complete